MFLVCGLKCIKCYSEMPNFKAITLFIRIALANFISVLITLKCLLLLLLFENDFLNSFFYFVHIHVKFTFWWKWLNLQQKIKLVPDFSYLVLFSFSTMNMGRIGVSLINFLGRTPPDLIQTVSVSQRHPLSILGTTFAVQFFPKLKWWDRRCGLAGGRWRVAGGGFLET